MGELKGELAVGLILVSFFFSVYSCMFLMYSLSLIFPPFSYIFANLGPGFSAGRQVLHVSSVFCNFQNAIDSAVTVVLENHEVLFYNSSLLLFSSFLARRLPG